MASAARLPDVEPSERDDLRREHTPSLPEFGVRDFYHEVYGPYASSASLVGGSLADDLGDIYRDLQDGLDLLERGTQDDRRDAIWSWRFGFHAHWGEHATGALRALYWLHSGRAEFP